MTVCEVWSVIEWGDHGLQWGFAPLHQAEVRLVSSPGTGSFTRFPAGHHVHPAHV
ncbi:hypothetical protein [Streptomyces sp. GbtcB6]|uniref:hypothetical protein n=1 Tax=Streptomyces sp. GbtcB6 TaxID=2824751 RepID=UPI001C30A239|nr:hypothetical protein [Streptomyces sp. GbtcB6]